ncbi:MAG: hypothetical protein ACXWXS_02885 [Actinomycetota bacterium]
MAGGTVARAYRELEADGVIATRGRHGSFVADMNGKAPRGVSTKAMADAAQAFAVRARQLGVDPKWALELAKDALDSFDTATGM